MDLLKINGSYPQQFVKAKRQISHLTAKNYMIIHLLIWSMII